MRSKSLLILGVIVAVLVLATPALAAPLSFEVTYDAAAGATPVDGRIIVVAADQFYADWGYPEPRFVPEGEGPATPPFWGKTVEAMAPGSTVTLGDGADVYGYPLPTIAELPEGDYWVQAVLNKYTTFDRADRALADARRGTAGARSPGRRGGAGQSDRLQARQARQDQE